MLKVTPDPSLLFEQPGCLRLLPQQRLPSTIIISVVLVWTFLTGLAFIEGPRAGFSTSGSAEWENHLSLPADRTAFDVAQKPVPPSPFWTAFMRH